MAIALTGVALRERPDPNHPLTRLNTYLREVTPARATAVLLEPLVRCPRPRQPFDPELVTEFLDVLPFFGADLGGGITTRERALCQCRVAEAARVVGRLDDAPRLLSDAAAVLLREGETLFPLRDLLTALDRAGDGKTAIELGRRWLPAFFSEFESNPNLAEAALLDQVERLLVEVNLAEVTELINLILGRRSFDSSDRPKILQARLFAARARQLARDGRLEDAKAVREARSNGTPRSGNSGSRSRSNPRPRRA